MNAAGPKNANLALQLFQFTRHYDPEVAIENRESILCAAELIQKMKHLVSSTKSITNQVSIKLPDGKPPSLELIINGFIFKYGNPEESQDTQKPFQRAIGQVVVKVLSKFCPKPSKMLEIGSGTVPIITYLHDVPLEVKSQIHLSDFNAKAVGILSKKYPKNPTATHDVRRLSTTVKAESFNSIVMMSVLDTFIRPHLQEACREIYKALKPGGCLVHFTARDSFQTATIHDYTSKDLIVFPLIRKYRSLQWNGLYVVDVKEFERKINALKDRNNMAIKKPLLEYAALTPAQREEFCLHFMLENKPEALLFLTNCLKKLNCEGVREVDIEGAFHERSREVLEETGFKVIKLEKQFGSFIGPRTTQLHHDHPDENDFSINHNRIDWENISVLAPKLIRETAKVHVIVARKPF